MGFYPFGVGSSPVTALNPSGDTTGVTDVANVQALINGGASRVLLAPGTFYGNAQVLATSPPVYIDGAGQWATIWKNLSAGPAFRMYSTSSYSAGGPAGGGLRGLTIDGAGASAGACGFHIGDIYNLEFDVGVRGFQGSGSKGAWLDNNYWWAEQMHGRIWAEQCSTHVQFDNSVNTSGTSTGSFVRTDLDILLDCKGKGNGVILANGATLMGGRGLMIAGNTDYGSALFYVLTITGSSSASGFSRFQDCTLDIDVECNGTSGTQPGTINIGTSGSNGIFRCTGNINFAGNNPFANANNWDGSFQYEGPAMGDTDLMRSANLGQQPYEQGAITTGGTVHTRYGSVVKALPAGNVTGLIMQVGALTGIQVSQYVTVINDGAGSMTWAAAATSHVAGGTSDVIAASAAATYIYDTDAGQWVRC